jgi:signal transduction histidine kinase
VSSERRAPTTRNQMMSIDAPAAKKAVTANPRYAVTLTAALGLAVTLLITSAGFAPAYQNRALHVAKETAGALVLLLVAALLAGRFTRRGTLQDLLALAGVLVLATKNLVFSVLTAILSETSGGPTTWRTTGAGMLGAGLLAAAALSQPRLVKERRRAMLITGGCSIAAFALLSSVADIFEFPGAFTEEPETREELRLLGGHPALVVADVGATILFLVAGAAFARRAERERDEFQMWLGIGAVVAGIGYLNYALFPSSYTDFLYAGDMFRVAAVAVWGFGAIREISAYQAAYASSAVLEERRRVARDLHDGVAQELAFISSQLHWLRRGSDDDETSGQIMEAVQRALDESRGAISALNRPLNEPLHLSLAHTAEEVAGRVGARLELDLDELVAVPPAWEEALPRIVREAVVNAVRHGGARTVTVHLRDADGVWLKVTDDGQGFDPSQPRSENSFGLMGMRERAESLGGEFKLSSAPGHGTSVEIVLP